MHKSASTECFFCDRKRRTNGKVPPPWCLYAEMGKPQRCYLQPLDVSLPTFGPKNQRVFSFLNRRKSFLLKVNGHVYLVSNNGLVDIGHGEPPQVGPNSQAIHLIRKYQAVPTRSKPKSRRRKK